MDFLIQQNLGIEKNTSESQTKIKHYYNSYFHDTMETEYIYITWFYIWYDPLHCFSVSKSSNYKYKKKIVTVKFIPNTTPVPLFKTKI